MRRSRNASCRAFPAEEKRRVALCRSLLARPDFLILDEPTNHLDTESIEWLEDFLARYSGTCLFVTHDRYFLDRIATRVVELSRGKFYSYEGNYTDYLLARAERAAVEEMQEHKRQKFLKRELEWVGKRRARGERNRWIGWIGILSWRVKVRRKLSWMLISLFRPRRSWRIA